MTQNNQLTINRLTQADIQSAFELFTSSITNTFEKEGILHLTDNLHSEIEVKQQKALASLAEHSDIYFLAAKINETVVGTISFAPCGEVIRALSDNQLDDVGELGSLYVLPSYQDQGVGSALIKELITYLVSQGTEQFCLDSGYSSAQSRWKRKFGEPYKVAIDYWGPGSAHMVWLCQVSDHIA
ncbi:GNAT family N-acetyltransferase [Paenibacillus sp. NPDC057934]|uniref:GNAT family N-acetyltransferase n=1 Tax=Paenibacillus sp. NPDC057934 TaxID=3346282 RepID=UPI0036DA5D3C